MQHNSTFKAVKVSEHVYWVGAVDWRIREFHGYATHRGTSYNAYLILGEKITLVDMVKAPFADEMLSRIASVIEPRQIDTVISNHAEMDHTGCLPRVMQEVQPERLVTSAKGAQALKAHFPLELPLHTVKSGEMLSLGDLELVFLETSMCHWPESMFTLLKDDGVLFSQDGFGMHLASSRRFADEFPEEVLRQEGAKYFANILMPYARIVAKLPRKLEGLGCDVRIIAPDHGPIFRQDPGWIVDCYRGWAAQEPTTKVVVAFETMWQSTERMAQAVGEGLSAGGASLVELMPLSSSHRSDVATELLDAGGLVVGSPTLNNSLFPSVADLLTYLKGLKPRGLVGAAFGSYGWSGEATAQIAEYFERMKIEQVATPLKVRYVPDASALGQCFELGHQVATTLCERCAGSTGGVGSAGSADSEAHGHA